ncbi:mitochondrial protein Pet127-domain-containing protein, partial [Pseudomassariella vexata]
IDVKRLYSHDLNLVPIVKPQPAVPSVSYGLDRVLFNPGVYHLQDPRSRVYNFDPYLSKIMPIKEFDFNALKQYVTSSKDETLIATAREHGKKYTGSTSSMTSMLSHFHFLLSSWRPINSEMVSQGFPVESEQYTAIMRAPAATFLHWKDGVYAIDADKEYDSSNILSMLGKSMEKLLTMTKEEYERYRHVNSDQISEEERNADEAFHYTGLGDFMMRSQLDAHDPRVPGTGMFDLKTRAVISIRMDAKGFQKGLGYEIRQRFGQWESFEREYHDMIRSAFLKYSLQVRMGRMDGIFVAFHNTQRIFGFQYIPLEEMDLSLHGTSNVLLGDKEFKLSLGLLNELLDRATNKFPEQSLRLHFETRQSEKTPFMYFFAKPVAPGEIEAVQNAGKASIDAFETEVLGLGKSPATTGATPESEDVLDIEDAEDAEDSGPSEIQDMEDVATWEEVRAMVDEAMEADEVGVGAVREAIEIALDESGLLESQSIENTRRYVDALLSAITGNEVSDEPQPSEDNSSASTPASSQEEIEAEDEEEAEESNGDNNPNASMMTLRNLIKRMAQKVDVGKPSAAQREADDSSRLKEFERILRNMITQSKAEDAARDIEDANDEELAELTEEKASCKSKEARDSELDGSLLGMVLTIRNTVNGEYVTRPNELGEHDDWAVEYNIDEMDAKRTRRLYEMCKTRRQKIFSSSGDRDVQWHQMWKGQLSMSTQKGRTFREQETMEAKTKPVYVVGEEGAKTYEEVFG